MGELKNNTKPEGEKVTSFSFHSATTKTLKTGCCVVGAGGDGGVLLLLLLLFSSLIQTSPDVILCG